MAWPEYSWIVLAKWMNKDYGRANPFATIKIEVIKDHIKWSIFIKMRLPTAVGKNETHFATSIESLKPPKNNHNAFYSSKYLSCLRISLESSFWSLSNWFYLTNRGGFGQLVNKYGSYRQRAAHILSGVYNLRWSAPNGRCLIVSQSKVTWVKCVK